MSELRPDEARDEVLHHWDVPGITKDALVRIEARAGHSTTIVGANGAGKSALGLWMEQRGGGSPGIRRLIAHRKLWFQSAEPELVPSQRERTRVNTDNWNRQNDSRYLDHAEGLRVAIVLHDLLAKVNHENAQRVSMYEGGASQQAVGAQFGLRFLDRLNAIFRSAGLLIELKMTEAQALYVFNTASKTEYPIFQMSDGEKSALLLAAEVLTTPERYICIIDEPERHLHRAISARLVETVIANRPDCHFVVLTHDLELAAALGRETGHVYSLAGCAWTRQDVGGWELFPVDTSAEIPESARLAILGGRRKLLFIEGEKQSLDLRLYELLFPDWTLFPVGGCDQVIRIVTGLRDSQSHHWLSARGVVDGDERTEKEKASLRDRGILALPVSEVESLYYSDAVMRAVAAIQAANLEVAADTLISDARAAALKALGEHKAPERIAANLALGVSRRRVLEELPTSIDPAEKSITVSFDSPYHAIHSRIVALLGAGDLDELIRFIPVRNTSMCNQIARSLQFQSVTNYEACARVRIREDTVLAAEVRALIGPIPA